MFSAAPVGKEDCHADVRVTERAIKGHPAMAVWQYLVAFEQVPLWEHGVLEVRRVGGAGPKVGDRISARRLYAGRESRLQGEISEYDEGHFAAMRLSGGPVHDPPRCSTFKAATLA